MYRLLITLLLGALLAGAAAPGEPPSVEALIDSAEEYALEGDFDSALPIYEKAISTLGREPRRQHALRYRYGIILNALGAQQDPATFYPLARAQFAAVLDYLESGGELEHSEARVSSALAHTYHQQAPHAGNPRHQTDMLRRAYHLYSDAALGLASDGEWHNLAITYFNIGQVCEWQGNLEEAIEWLEKAVELDLRHGFPDLQEDRAYLYALREQVNPPARATTTAL
ncbi:tetratricopeptide repeat protein [Microbulbifer yueqingensis]|uniref:Tetratricopeptide repeat-containing protein n=1 Tax=Microbulbifer yueqingensis TaxID=658219 RepID=A0A1G8VXH0_9GAMM|nr:tetratricopeptide repeat protein [Microbulbifer yueqingensis]SDJ69930.1 Tetratricopeptide repeat-containing protein [Microbulbifer yueqingensis]